MIIEASHEIWERRTEAQRSRYERGESRRRIAAIDAFITLLEERHLNRESTFDPVLRRRLLHLEREVGLPAPRAAVMARNTKKLHAALLDWQEALLDAVKPERLRYADVHDSDWSTPQPVGW